MSTFHPFTCFLYVDGYFQLLSERIQNLSVVINYRISLRQYEVAVRDFSRIGEDTSAYEIDRLFDRAIVSSTAECTPPTEQARVIRRQCTPPHGTGTCDPPVLHAGVNVLKRESIPV